MLVDEVYTYERYEYNSQGQKISLKTYSDPAPIVLPEDTSVENEVETGPKLTQWYYNGNGLLAVKIDPNLKERKYFYYENGQLNYIRNARGNKTDYQYNTETHRLENIRYYSGLDGSQFESEVIFGYDIAGHLTEVTDDAGHHILTVDPLLGTQFGESTSRQENSQAIFDLHYKWSKPFAHRTGYTLTDVNNPDQAAMDVDFGYNSKYHMDQVSSSFFSGTTLDYTYGFRYPGTIESIERDNTTTTIFHEGPRRQITDVHHETKPDTGTPATLSQHQYGYNGEGRRKYHQVSQPTYNGGSLTGGISTYHYRLGYDPAGQLSAFDYIEDEYEEPTEDVVIPFLPDFTTNPDQLGENDAAYEYDLARNVHKHYTPSGVLEIGYDQADQISDFWFIEYMLTGEVWSLDEDDKARLTYTPDYDESGNMTENYPFMTLLSAILFNQPFTGFDQSEEKESFGYDVKNRLVSYSLGDVTMEFVYDWKNRMRKKYDYASDGSIIQTTEYHYDDNLLIHERTYTYTQGQFTGIFVTIVKSSPSLDWNNDLEPLSDTSRYYLWGLDIAGTLQGSGGVGALLAIHDTATSETYHVLNDVNGNVTNLVTADTTIAEVVATYHYTPDGKLASMEGDYADQNPFRFSTKYQLSALGLEEDQRFANRFLYFGNRFLDTRNTRWINRDPIEEAGGVNLYAFVNNDPVNSWDYMGFFDEASLYEYMHNPPSPPSPRDYYKRKKEYYSAAKLAMTGLEIPSHWERLFDDWFHERIPPGYTEDSELIFKKLSQQLEFPTQKELDSINRLSDLMSHRGLLVLLDCWIAKKNKKKVYNKYRKHKEGWSVDENYVHWNYGDRKGMITAGPFGPNYDKVAGGEEAFDKPFIYAIGSYTAYITDEGPIKPGSSISAYKIRINNKYGWDSATRELTFGIGNFREIPEHEIGMGGVPKLSLPSLGGNADVNFIFTLHRCNTNLKCEAMK